MSYGNLCNELWPVHQKPKEDELLSSWLVRLALSLGLKLHTFCSVTWPRKQIWNRDIDKSADAEIVEVLSVRTGTPIERVRRTTLADYEDILYEHHNLLGPTSWIMPVGVYHRIRRQYGLQYCPFCLAEDKEPYYRRKWRLAFIVLCEKHHILLHDRCPECDAPINFHRDELGNYHKSVATSLTLCHICRFDLRNAFDNKLISPVTSVEVRFTELLLQAMTFKFAQVSTSVTTYSYLFFSVLRQMVKILAMRNKRIDDLRRDISKTYDVEVYIPPQSHMHTDIQELSINSRRQLLALAYCLLEEWPHRFIQFSQKHRIWSSLWLRHLEPCERDPARTAPFWFWSVIHENLYRARYCPSYEEINAALNFLKQNGNAVNKSTLARLLGVAVMRRADVLL